jgi:hypothetical protein
MSCVIKLSLGTRYIYLHCWKIRSNVYTHKGFHIFILYQVQDHQTFFTCTVPVPGTLIQPNHSTLYYLFLFFFFFRVFFALRSFAPVNCSDAFLMATLDNSSSSPISSKLSPSASSIVSKPSSTGKDIL